MSARAMVSTHLVQADGWWARDRGARPRGWSLHRRSLRRPADVTAPAATQDPATRGPSAREAATSVAPAAALGAPVPSPRHRVLVVDLREPTPEAAVDAGVDAGVGAGVGAGGPRHRR